MKRILSLILVLSGLLVQDAMAQLSTPPNYVPYRSRVRHIATYADSTLHVPFGATASLRGGGYNGAGAIFWQTSDSTFYGYSGFNWHRMAKYSDLGVYLTFADTNVLATQWWVLDQIAGIDLSDYLQKSDSTAPGGYYPWSNPAEYVDIDEVMDSIVSVAPKFGVEDNSATANRLFNIGNHTLTLHDNSGAGTYDPILKISNNLFSGSNRDMLFIDNAGNFFGNAINIESPFSSGYGIRINGNRGAFFQAGTSSLWTNTIGGNQGVTFQNTNHRLLKSVDAITLQKVSEDDSMALYPGQTIAYTMNLSGSGTVQRVGSIDMIPTNTTLAGVTNEYFITGKKDGVNDTLMNMQPGGIIRVNNNNDTLATLQDVRDAGGGGTWGSITGTLSDQTDLQSALDAKQATITGGATTITSSNLTASRALVSDGSGKVAVATTTSTEIGYVNGVTSSIQPQLDGKQPIDSDLTTIAGLTATTDNFLVSVSSAWASRTPTQAKTTLGLNNVENTALSTWAGSSNITTVGTISSGTWGGTDISNSAFRQSGALSVVGRSANSTGDVDDISAGSDHQVLRRSGTSLGFGAVNLASTNAVTGDLPFSNVAQLAGFSVAGKTGTGTGDIAAITASADQVLRRSGSGNLEFGTLVTNNIGDAQITNAKLANSTISGIALGNNLADLTATNGTLTFSGTYNGSTARTIGLNLNNANTWGDGFKQTFNPDATNAGLNVGAHTANPSSPANGDVYYNSTDNELRARINGSWVALGAGGGGGTWGSITGTLSAQTDLQSALDAKVSLTGAETVTNKRITKRVQTVANAATITPSIANDDEVDITAIAQNFTIANPTGTPTSQQPLTITILDNGTPRTINWGSDYADGGVGLPTVTVANKITKIGFRWNPTRAKYMAVALVVEP